MPINYKEYPPDWKERREKILKRAEYKCEWCGVPQHSWVRWKGTVWFMCKPDDKGAKYIILTVMHLDHDHEN